MDNPLAEFWDLPASLTISGIAEAIQNGVLGMQYDPSNTAVSDLNHWGNNIESLQHSNHPPSIATLTGLPDPHTTPYISYILYPISNVMMMTLRKYMAWMQQSMV